MRISWFLAAGLLLACAYKVGVSEFFGNLSLLLVSGLLVTVLLYFHDRVRGKNAFIGSVLVKPGDSDGLTKYVDVLTAAVGVGSAGYLFFGPLLNF
jgi:hypothetical protein